MDDRGIVPLGDISHSLIIEDGDWPMGIKNRYLIFLLVRTGVAQIILDFPYSS